MPFIEFPKWIRRPGHADVLVDNAEAEALQIELWDIEGLIGPGPHQFFDARGKVDNALLPQLDHDANGKPGGSLKPEGADLPALRIAYKEKFGKRAFPGWDAAEITKRMEADA